jgi:acyl-CoA thioester hydrolase
MKKLEKTLESKTKIRFTDCDPFNHLNNSKYIDYFFNEREDQLLVAYDFDLQKIARNEGLCWVVAQNQVAYISPATLMETVIIRSQLLMFDEKNLLLEAQMWNENKTVLKSLLWSKLVHFNLKTKRSELHNTMLSALFAQIENPLDKKISFDERVKDLKPVIVL